MTREELGLVRERFVHPLKAAIIMMVAETAGGMVPLTPYIITPDVQVGFLGVNWGTDKGSVYEADETDIDGVLEQDYGKRNRHQTDLRCAG